MQFLISAADWLWSNVLGYLLIAVGVFFAVLLGAPQIRHFKLAFHKLMHSNKGEEGGISGFGTLMAAMGGQLGTGSLVGVSSALAAGGPGAVFWMWVTALFGMTVSLVETVLGQLFRKKQPDGELTGGPSYYIEHGVGSRKLAVVMSVLYVLGIGMSVCSLQTNSIANAFTGVMKINPIVPGIIVVALAFFINIGGMKRLTKTSSIIVPFMVMIYFAVVLFIIISNITHVPHVFALIFQGAFTRHAVVGGVGGWTVANAFRQGVARGMFSNDAGNGCAAIMHASADVKHPIDQGMLGMIGTFITTIIVCTLTALAILMTGVLGTGQDGILLLQAAFESVLHQFGNWIIFVAMLLFGFTTLLADMHYGEANIAFIFKEKAKLPIWIYRFVLSAVLIVSSVISLKLVWSSVDFFVGLIVLINIFAMIYLSKYVKFIYENYFGQRKAGKEEPVWNYNIDIMQVDLKDPVDVMLKDGTAPPKDFEE
ncbi:MAG: alanine/glycine:cation symporter family protein [Pseudoramibacter sp.]|jgi:AGCS family alanine or glycine:cation symporter